MELHGIHHLTAVTAQAARNVAFYTRILGLRLVKKSVNQDDVSAYHLFYADGVASPGTDITFFDWPAARERRGTRSIARTFFRVGSEASLHWWAAHLAAEGVTRGDIATRDGRATLEFEDGEGQRLGLVVDRAPPEPAHPWAKSPVPAEHQLLGLGPIVLSVPALEPTARVLTGVLNLRRVRDYRLTVATAGAAVRATDAASVPVAVHVFAMGPGGPSAELHVAVEPTLAPARAGAGGVHHVALRTTQADYAAWAERLEAAGMPLGSRK